MTKTTFFLAPRTARQKSFYGKAQVELTAKGSYILYSYETPVAIILADKTVRTTPNFNHYTNTTCRHIQDFIDQFAPDTMARYIDALLRNKPERKLTRREVLQGFGTSEDEFNVLLRTC